MSVSLQPHESGRGTLRHFAAPRQFGRFWREADMKRIYEHAPVGTTT
jgi:hypothetical protein